MRRVHLLSGAAFLLLAAFLGYHTLGLTYYTRLGPGPGFFPRWLCALLAVLALAILARATRSEPDEITAEFFPDRQGSTRIVVVVAALIAVALSMNMLGFQLAMFAFYLVLLPALGRWGWVETPVLAALGSFATYYLFVRWLSLPLPIGVFGF